MAPPIDWTAVARRAEQMMSRLQRERFVFDPLAPEHSLYAGAATTPRSDDLRPGAGQQVANPMMGSSISASTRAPASGTPSASGSAAAGSGTTSAFAPAGFEVPSAAGPVPLTPAKPALTPEQQAAQAAVSYTPMGKGISGHTMPVNGQLAYGMNAPDIPADQNGRPGNGYWVQQGRGNVAHDYANGESAYRWVENPTAQNIPGIREMIQQLWGQIQGQGQAAQPQVPASAGVAPPMPIDPAAMQSAYRV